MTDSLNNAFGSWIVETWATPAPTGPASPESTPPPEPASEAEDALRIITRMLSSGDPRQAHQLLVDWLRQFTGCRQVVLAMRRHGGRCRVRAISDVAGFDAHAGLLGSYQDALEETLSLASPLAWPREVDGGHTAGAHAALARQLGSTAVCSVPLRMGDEQPVGAVLLVDPSSAHVEALLDRYGEALITCLTVLERTRASLLARSWRWLSGWARSWRGRGVVVAAIAVALLLAMPWPYRIRCQCQIQPVTRRFVAAPYDGTLETALASAGDVVQAGDVLARMDAREIRWELAGLETDLARATKQRDAAMAAHRTGDTQLAELEMERLQVQIELLQHRLENLAIRSPMDAVVVTGDLEKVQGAPLTIGQTLFEVAPLESMNVEVEIPESEIAHLAPGMPVTVRLDALTDMSITGTLERIHPQAELRRKQSVFVADMVTRNPDGRLRPGMNGWAEITSEKKRLGWILFHKPWYRLRGMLSW